MSKLSVRKRILFFCISAALIILCAIAFIKLSYDILYHFKYNAYLKEKGIPTVLYTRCINDKVIIENLSVEHGEAAWGKDISEHYIFTYSEDICDRLWELEDSENWRYLPMSGVEYEEYCGQRLSYFGSDFCFDELMTSLPLTTENITGRWYCAGVREDKVDKQRYLLIDIRTTKTLVYIYESNYFYTDLMVPTSSRAPAINP